MTLFEPDEPAREAGPGGRPEGRAGQHDRPTAATPERAAADTDEPVRVRLTVAYEDKPTVILEGTGGWSDRIREIAYDGKHLDEAHRATLHFASTPTEAVELALSLAARGQGESRAAERELES